MFSPVILFCVLFSAYMCHAQYCHSIYMCMSIFVYTYLQVALLKKHGCLVPESRLQALDAAPSKWEEVIRKAFEAKEAILPLQNAEVQNIKAALDSFSSEVKEFREAFLQIPPFDARTEPENAYKAIDDFYFKCLSLEQHARELNNLETLFDIAKSQHKELKDSKEELKTLKASKLYTSLQTHANHHSTNQTRTSTRATGMHVCFFYISKKQDSATVFANENAEWRGSLLALLKHRKNMC